MSGMKIIFHKSESFLFGDANDKREVYKNIFTCQVGEIPMKYLGVPLNKVRIRNRDWKLIKKMKIDVPVRKVRC